MGAPIGELMAEAPEAPDVMAGPSRVSSSAEPENRIRASGFLAVSPMVSIAAVTAVCFCADSWANFSLAAFWAAAVAALEVLLDVGPIYFF